ncbi:uncharacterized protein LOC143522697 isoform X2 [Brachyhypopomus gauderio]|uniref:uncharacterized protein LOC143522697 isoform X2 n=1 Tax=Brachyhypopomus gauderio TaxID=698409 RepID=UPI004042AAFC
MLLRVCVFFIVLHLTEGCTVVKSTSQLHIRSHVGDSALLPCYCTNTHTRPERFIWFKVQDSNHIQISSESEQYRNRVQLGTAHSPGNLSLLISHLTEEDGGLYRCYIEGSEYTDMKLTVEVRQKIIQGHVGGSVLLSCSRTGLHTNTLIWTFKDKEIYPTDQTQRYTGRVQLVTDSPGNPSLHISHLTEKDEGVYRCVINGRTFRRVILDISATKVQTSPGSKTTASYQRPTGPHSTPDKEVQTPHTKLPPVNIVHLTEVSTKDTEFASVTKVQTIPGSKTTASYQRPTGTHSTETPAKDVPVQTTKSTLVITGQTRPATTTPVSSQRTNHKESTYITMACITIPVLMLVGMGGVIYWRYRVQRQRQEESGGGHPGGRREQKTQDDVMYSTLIHSNAARKTHKIMDSGEKTEYATIQLHKSTHTLTNTSD